MGTDRGREHGRRDNSGRYDCVEPELGDRLWRLDDPATPDNEVRRLHAHVSVCHACRLQRAVGQRLEQSLREAAFESPRGGARWPSGHFGGGAQVAGGAGLLLAACLALVFIVPPRRDGPLTRGGEGWGIVRPVPGEVVQTTTPRIFWRPVADARAYQVTIADERGGLVWQVESGEPHVRVPAAAGLSRPGLFRVTVHPIPAYLASPAGSSSWLRTGPFFAFVGYRLSAAPAWVHGLGLLALATLAVAGALRMRRR